MLEIVTFQDSAACGLNMGVGQRWRLNLERWDGQLHTSLCSGSELLSDYAPVPSPSPGEVPDTASPVYALLAAVASGLVGLLMLILAWFGIGLVM
jgi:hypothetical protein